MGIFKTKNFVRWALKEKIKDSSLEKAVDEIKRGVFDVVLGGGLIKKRVARMGQGKRGGYRVFLAFKQHDRAIFIFGFSKKDRENLDDDEKALYKKLSQFYLSVTMRALDQMCKSGGLFEVCYEET